MKLAKCHKFLAWTIGGWLALISLSGSVLLFKNEIFNFQYPQLLPSTNEEMPKSAVLSVITTSKTYQYIMLPAANVPYYQAVNIEGDIDYWGKSASLLLTRSYLSDFLSIVEQLHMNLLFDDMGHQILGIISILSLFLIVSGLIHWWPKNWSRRLWRVDLKFGLRSFRQWHTALASVGFLVLLIPILTSIGMLYKQPSIEFLQFMFNEPVIRAQKIPSEASHRTIGNEQWGKWISSASSLDFLKDATLTRVYLRQKSDDLVTLRFKRADEWHQYGRNFIYLDPNTAEIKKVKSTYSIGNGLRWYQRVYPLHTAYVGGAVLKIILCLVGTLPLLLFLSGGMYHKYLKKRM